MQRKVTNKTSHRIANVRKTLAILFRKTSAFSRSKILITRVRIASPVFLYISFFSTFDFALLGKVPSRSRDILSSRRQIPIP